MQTSKHFSGRELGHLHGDHVAHFAFPKDLWGRLHAGRRVSEHPIFPGKPGRGERRIADADDVADVLALLGLNYERAVSRPGAAAGSVAHTDYPNRKDMS